jgi:hypothetical protein
VATRGSGASGMSRHDGEATPGAGTMSIHGAAVMRAASLPVEGRCGPRVARVRAARCVRGGGGWVSETELLVEGTRPCAAPAASAQFARTHPAAEAAMRTSRSAAGGSVVAGGSWSRAGTSPARRAGTWAAAGAGTTPAAAGEAASGR